MAQLATPMKKRKIKGDGAWGYAFIAVALVIYAMFTAYPIVSAFLIVFRNTDRWAPPI